MKKVLVTIGIIVGILLVVMIGMNIYTSNHSLKNYDTPTNELNMPGTQTNTSTNAGTSNSVLQKNKISASELKKYIDDYDYTLKTQGSYKTSMSSEWTSSKKQQSPYYDVIIKSYKYNNSVDIAAIAITSDNDGQIIELSFTGLNDNELSRYGKNVSKDFTQLMVNMGFYLGKWTNDSEIQEYYFNELSSSVKEQGGILFNKYKNGIKIFAGGNKNVDEYLHINFTLEEYTVD